MTRPVHVRQAVGELVRERYENGRCSRDDFNRAELIASDAEDEIGEYVDDTAIGWERLSSWLGARNALSSL